MNFCLVYILTRWLGSIENETETKASKFVKKLQDTVIGCGKRTTQIYFLFFSLEAIYLSPESLERIIC